MMRTILALCGILAACEFGAYGAEAAPGGGEHFRAEARGFGSVEVALRTYGEGAKRSSWTTFEAEDAEHAAVLGSKRLADLLGFGDIELVTNADLPGTVLGLDGAGCWLLGLDGARFQELFAPSKEALANLTEDCGAAAWQPVPQRAYPRWLDATDNAAMCFWFSGFGVVPKDSDADFRWLAEYGFTAVIHSGATEERLVAPGLIDTAALDWQRELAREYDVPFKTMENMVMPIRPSWLWNTTPLPYEMSTYMPVAQTDRFMKDYRRRFAGYLAADPNFIGHMVCQEGPGGQPGTLLSLAEVAHTPQIQTLWHEYLREARKFSLEDVARRYRADAGAFRRWEDVPIPTLKELSGWDPAISIDLLDGWCGRADRGGKAMEERWFSSDAPADGWTPVDFRDQTMLLYQRTVNRQLTNPYGGYWLRRRFTVTPDRATAKYLHVPRGWGHNGHNHGTFPLEGYEVWVNGTKLAMIGNVNLSNIGWDLCYDAGPALKPGANLIVVNTKGFPLPADYGYAFLGRLGPWVYPGDSEALNARAFDMVNFMEWLNMAELERRMIGIRAGESYRPMKIMAPHNYIDAVLDLCKRYGAYPHDTGLAGAMFAPFKYSRYAMTRGLTNSVEPGGPPGSTPGGSPSGKVRPGIQAMSTRYLMMGTEMVDWVASVEKYSTGEIGEWIAQNRELLRCIGKLELAAPRIGILRVGREHRMGITEVFAWDLGRGSLCSIGRPFLYATLGDLKSGRADRFPVLLDSGTTVLSEDEVGALEAYVRQGGTFVAFHNTGMHTPEKRLAWPISKLTGLRVAGTTWGGAKKIRFTGDQNLWPRLRGAELLSRGLVLSAPAAADIDVVAQWQGLDEGEGAIAVAVRRLGRGKVVTLGSNFYRNARDEGGHFVEVGTLPYLDELLESIGAPRESRGNGLSAEPWRSKNGIYDVWTVAQMNPETKPDAFEVQLRRETAAPALRELSAPGHPPVAARHADGWLTLSGVRMEAMQARVFGTPRADLASGARDWFGVLARRWHPVRQIEPGEIERATVETPDSILPLVDGWRCDTGEMDPAAWTRPGSEPAGDWKTMRLGAFATMGLPDGALARFRKEIELPPSWRDQEVTLVFDPEGHFWGINPSGRLWINGEPAAIAQPIRPASNGYFRIALTPTQMAAGRLVLALEVDGRQSGRAGRPKGVSGAFFLEARPRPVRSLPLDTWSAATDLNVLTPAAAGRPPAKPLYYETRFTLPAAWPARRLWLASSPGSTGPKMRRFFINNDELAESTVWGSMPEIDLAEIDISGWVKREGENVLRWVPDPQAAAIPDLKLLWTE
jgi:hypothetical protein